MRGVPKKVAITKHYENIESLAEPARGIDDGVQHRLQLGRRATDDVEHFARRGLVVEGLLQLPTARLNFLEQTGVLDGYHRLIRESAQ